MNDTDDETPAQPSAPVDVVCVYIPPGSSPEEADALVAAARAKRAAKLGLAPAQIAPNPTNNTRPHTQTIQPRRKPAASPAKPPSRAAHEAHCTVCSHQDRGAIEDEFLHWHSTSDIAIEFRVQRRAIYRHARALNLFSARNRNLRDALGFVIEHAASARTTGDTVVRAIRALTRVNDEGQWIEPPSHVIVSSGIRVPAPLPQPPQIETTGCPVLAPSDSQNSLCEVTPPRASLHSNGEA